MALEAKLLKNLRRHGLLPEVGPLVVGVSGGADSLALLHALHRLRLASSIRVSLHVATLDHGLRGEAGAADARFVVETCRQWGIPATAGKADVPALVVAKRIGLETAAREARYQFLASIAREVGATHVAVAHHAGDQAETVLMKLVRGTGITGLKGMAPKAPLPYAPDLTLVRPLLSIRRVEIDAYVREHGLQPREDETNRDVSLSRNRIRHELLPMLRDLNPQIEAALGNLAEIARVEDAYMEAQVTRLLEEADSEGEAGYAFSRATFRGLHPALQRRVLQALASRFDVPGSASVAYPHLIAAVETAARGQVGAVAHLSGGLQLRVDYETVVIGPTVDRSPTTAQPVIEEMPVAIPGVTALPDGRKLVASEIPMDGVPMARLAISSDSHVLIRTRRPGDRFAPLGMGGHSLKLKDWMINRKVPKSRRDNLPLLIVDGQIAAILIDDQWPVAEAFAVHGETLGVVYFYLDSLGVT